MLVRARLWLRSLLLRRRLEREMQEEMADHLERATARLVARGLPPAEARREARREFGNVTHIQREGRDARGMRALDAVVADCRYALRHFARTRLTTLTMFVVLAAGISISVVLFSFVHALAQQPPSGVARADDLVRIRGSRGLEERRFRLLTAEEFGTYRAMRDQFRAVAGWTHARLPLVVSSDAERRSQSASVMFVTENYFAVLGVQPILGPGLPTVGAEDGVSSAVAVIGYATWEQLFGRDSGVIGATVSLGGVPVTVVGVAPERFYGVSTLHERLELWMPLAAQRIVRPDPASTLFAVARLRPGVALRSASAAARVVAERVGAADDTLRAQHPSAAVVPLLAMNSDPEFERESLRVYLLVGIIGLLVLLVTCTNVSALLMGLATARRQEISVRLALGAARGRLVRQLLTESVLLGVAAGAAALGITWVVLRLARGLMAALPFEVVVTWPTTAFTFGVALAVGVLFGLSPALHGTRIALAGALRDSAAAVSGGRGRLQRALVIAQITFTQPLIALLVMVLLIVLAELQPRRQTEIGDRVMRVQIRPAVQAFDESPAALAARARLAALVPRVTERLRALPGVDATVIEWRGESALGHYAVHPDDRVPGGEQGLIRIGAERAAPGYFATLGVRVVRGRDFAPSDVGAPYRRLMLESAPGAPDVIRRDPQVAEERVIVGADLARRAWGGANPVGRRLQAASDTVRGARTLLVAGVIDDPMAATREADKGFRVYLPPDTTQPPLTVLVRTLGLASPHLAAVRTAVFDETHGMVAEVRTLADIEEEAQRSRRIAAGALSAAGAMALLLSAIGLYAVVAFGVAQRTREIAVRMAVGAPAGRIVRQFVVAGVRLGAIGLALGLPLGLLGLRALHAFEADFPPLPVIPVALVASLGVLGTATLAAWLPARRAATVDPAVTLRAE